MLDVTPLEEGIEVRWAAVSSATSYRLFVARSGGLDLTNSPAIEAATPGATLRGLSAGVAYDLTLVPVFGASAGAPSATRTATPLAPAASQAIEGTFPAEGTSVVGADLAELRLELRRATSAALINASTFTATYGPQATALPLAASADGRTVRLALGSAVPPGVEVTLNTSLQQAAGAPLNLTSRFWTKAAGPTGLTATPGNRAVALDWQPVAGANRYAVWRPYSTTTADPHSGAAARSDATDWNANDQGADYTVYAYGPWGESLPSATVRGASDPTRQVAPWGTPGVFPFDGLDAIDGSGDATIFWSEGFGPNFQVLRAEGDGPFTVVADNWPQAHFHDTGLTNGTRYTYRVVALASGQAAASVPSIDIEVRPAATHLTAPSAFTAQGVAGGVQLQWSPVVGARAYMVFNQSAVGTTPQPYTSVVGTSVTIPSGSVGGTNHWAVAALDQEFNAGPLTDAVLGNASDVGTLAPLSVDAPTITSLTAGNDGTYTVRGSFPLGAAYIAVEESTDGVNFSGRSLGSAFDGTFTLGGWSGQTVFVRLVASSGDFVSGLPSAAQQVSPGQSGQLGSSLFAQVNPGRNSLTYAVFDSGGTYWQAGDALHVWRRSRFGTWAETLTTTDRWVVERDQPSGRRWSYAFEQTRGAVHSPWDKLGNLATYEASGLGDPGVEPTVVAGNGCLSVTWPEGIFGVTRPSLFVSSPSTGRPDQPQSVFFTGPFENAASVCGLTGADARVGVSWQWRGYGLSPAFGLPVTVTLDPTAPAVPDLGTNVVSIAGHLATELVWTAVPGATGYEIHRADPRSGYRHIGTSPTAHWVDRAVTDGSSYRYRVQARTGTKVGPMSEVVELFPVATLPLAPHGGRAFAGQGCISALLEAEPSEVPSTQHVLWSSKAGAPWQALSFSTTGRGLGLITECSLTNGETRELAWSASKQGNSVRTSIGTVTPSATAPSRPTNVSAQFAAGVATLTFSASTGDGHVIWRKGTSEAAWSAVGLTRTSPWRDPAPLTGNSFYAVQGWTTAGDVGALSDTASVSVP